MFRTTIAGNVIDLTWDPKGSEPSPFRPGDHLCQTQILPLKNFLEKEHLPSSHVARWGSYLKNNVHLDGFVYEHPLTGEYLCIWCHHGLLIDDNLVLHLTRKQGLILSDLRFFAQKNVVERIHYTYADADNEEQLRRQAILRGWQVYHSLTQKELIYELSEKNCEHVVRYCKTGEWESMQVKKVEKNVLKWMYDCMYEISTILFNWYIYGVEAAYKHPELALIMITVLLFIVIMYLLLLN